MPPSCAFLFACAPPGTDLLSERQLNTQFANVAAVHRGDDNVVGATMADLRDNRRPPTTNRHVAIGAVVQPVAETKQPHRTLARDDSGPALPDRICFGVGNDAPARGTVLAETSSAKQADATPKAKVKAKSSGRSGAKKQASNEPSSSTKKSKGRPPEDLTVKARLDLTHFSHIPDDKAHPEYRKWLGDESITKLRHMDRSMCTQSTFLSRCMVYGICQRMVCAWLVFIDMSLVVG